MGRKTQHRFQGSPERFSILAKYIYNTFGKSIKYVADVAGGQGMLSRLLNKKFQYDSEVVDPRGWVLKGVPYREVEFSPSLANYYDLIVGLHPDEATRAVASSALFKPVILIPCCNFWSLEKLGRDELVHSIASYYEEQKIIYKVVEFKFKGPKNIGLVSIPPNYFEEDFIKKI